jgi:hypothetical protein
MQHFSGKTRGKRRLESKYLKVYTLYLLEGKSMYVRGKEVRMTKSAFEDMVKTGLSEHKVLSVMEEGRITRVGKTEKHYAEAGKGRKIVRVVYVEYPNTVVVVSVNIRGRKGGMSQV